MKKKKLNLKDLKVKSFVTSISEVKGETVKGGNQQFDPSNHCSEVCSYLCEASAGICPSEDCESAICFEISSVCNPIIPIVVWPFN